MPFDIADWKRKIGQSLKAFKADIRREGPGATALLPLARAIQGGNIEQASGAAIALAGAVGGNLLANLAQKLADTPKEQQDERAQQGREQVIAQEAADDAYMADALDAMLDELDMIEQVRAGLGKEDKAWFTETLRAELRDLGSSLIINAQGAVVLGNVQVPRGDFVARDKIINNYYGADHVDWAKHYLRQLMFNCNRLPLGEMNDREGAENTRGPIARDPMTLDQVYVTLNVRDPQAGREDERETEFISIAGREQNRGLPARSAVARSELAVLHGAPGSGKSAFVRQLAADLCAAQLEQTQLPGVMRSTCPTSKTPCG